MWQRSFLTTLTLLGEDAEHTPALETFTRELAGLDRTARARSLAREATAILVDVAALTPNLNPPSGAPR